MNAKGYFEWAKHYDPDFHELKFLSHKEIDFTQKKVLEVGCGTGRFTQRISPYASEILGIDPDEEALIVCKQNIRDENVKLKVGTLETLSIPPNYYDYIVFSWSMYMIEEKEKNIRLAYDILKAGGKLVVLQANSGEFEEEISKLYSYYASLEAYENAYGILSDIISNIFGNVTTGEMTTYFLFDNVEQVTDKSIFFIEDEEGTPPTEQSIIKFKDNLQKYYTPDGSIKMTDIVSVFIATK